MPRKGKQKMKIPTARQLPSGSWFVQLRIGGKSIPITAPTQAAAVAQAMAYKAGIQKLKRAPEKLTLSQAYSEYIASRQDLSPSTLAGYNRLKANTFQSLMPKQLRSITNAAIQQEIRAMQASGLSPKYISNALGLLRPVLKAYYKDFELDVTIPKKQRHRLPMPSDADIRSILEAAKGTEIELPILLAVWLGMRLSEIRAVRRQDITGTKLHIHSAIVDGIDGKPVEKDPKTYTSDRWIDVPPYILSLIPPGQPEEHIVTLTGQAIYKRYSRLLEKNNIPHYRFHDLRHANAAAMIRLGIDSKYAMERNGWATDYMYKQVYGYIMEDKMAEESKRIDAYFLPKIENANKNANNK